MSEEIKYDHIVDIKEHVDLLKKALKNGQPYRVFTIDVDHLYDKAIHYEIVLRSNKYGNTKTFSTYLSVDAYNKVVKPLMDKLEPFEIVNKRHPEDETKRIRMPMITERQLEATQEEDLASFFDDFVGEK